MTRQPKAIIVGTGFGCRAQLPALRAAGFDVVALVGSDPARTAERAGVNIVPGSFVDLDEAIAQMGADLVAISAPPHAHAELAITALERGCHVLCEKPFAANTEEAEKMLAAARKSGKLHRVGHEIRFDPPQALLTRALAEGMIGEPRLASVMMLLPQLRTQADEMPDWWFDPAEGGGWLGALGSHLVDLLRCWLGEFETVSATVGSVADARGPVDDSFNVRFRMQNGVDGILQSTAGAWGPVLDVTRICGTSGTLRIEGAKVMLSGPAGERELPTPDDLALPPLPPLNSDPRHQSTRWKYLVPVELPSYTKLCMEMRAAMDGQAGPVIPANFEDGLACMRVIDAIRASACDGGQLVRI